MGDGLSLFVRLLDMAFEQLANCVPTVLRVDAVTTEGNTGSWDFQLPWSLRDADLSPELIIEGSVLLLPPRGRGIGQKFAPHEEALLACAPAGQDKRPGTAFGQPGHKSANPEWVYRKSALKSANFGVENPKIDVAAAYPLGNADSCGR